MLSVVFAVRELRTLKCAAKILLFFENCKYKRKKAAHLPLFLIFFDACYNFLLAS